MAGTPARQRPANLSGLGESLGRPNMTTQRRRFCARTRKGPRSVAGLRTRHLTTALAQKRRRPSGPPSAARRFVSGLARSAATSFARFLAADSLLADCVIIFDRPRL